MCAQSLGRVVTFIADFGSAMIAAQRMFKIIDRVPTILVNEGQFPQESFKGALAFKKVYFRYPTRREIRAIENFSYNVVSQASVGLVGQSGCGKSTLLQLVQRFYDVDNHGADSGIFLDGMNIKTLDPRWIRQQIGIVSQEPVLFDMTLAENIAYGDNNRESVPIEEIIEAARAANIHDFIASLPEGYNTRAGQMGSQLSGGQKQRIAIARLLIRKPTLLLFDEATSALDAESERIVQEALDAATVSRTTLIVAHRISTIENSDAIVVMAGGRMIESGSSQDLINKRGAFYEMRNASKIT